MYIINARTSHNEDLFLAIIDDKPIWTCDVERIKIFSDPEKAAIILNDAMLHRIDDFENFNLAEANTVKICKLFPKELY